MLFGQDQRSALFKCMMRGVLYTRIRGYASLMLDWRLPFLDRLIWLVDDGIQLNQQSIKPSKNEFWWNKNNLQISRIIPPPKIKIASWGWAEDAVWALLPLSGSQWAMTGTIWITKSMVDISWLRASCFDLFIAWKAVSSPEPRQHLSTFDTWETLNYSLVGNSIKWGLWHVFRQEQSIQLGSMFLTMAP